jgi:hypothetical protein
MTWRWRLRPVIGVLAVAVALAGAVHASRTVVSVPTTGDHKVHDVASVHSPRLVVSHALPAPGRAPARQVAKSWRIPAGVLPVAAALAAVALAAIVASAVRGRRLTETPTRLPPRAPPAAGTSVPGHGVGRRPALVPFGFGAVPVPG